MSDSEPTAEISASSYYNAKYTSVLVDALPRLAFDDSILKQLSTESVAPDDNIRKQSRERRLDFLAEISNLHIALNCDRDLCQQINGMIRSSYYRRGSIPAQRRNAPDQIRSLVATTEEASEQKTALASLIAKSWSAEYQSRTGSLIGIAGRGKSRAVARAAFVHKSCIFHPADRDPRLPRLQIPVLIVETPADGTIPSLIAVIFSAIQEVTGEKIEARLKKGNRSTLIANVAEVLVTFCVGIVIFDESQKMVRVNGEVNAVLLNFMLEICNQLRVPVLFVGTPGAMNLFSGEFRNARRMLGRPWMTYKNDSLQWRRFVDGLWPFQFTEQFTPITDELRNTLDEITMRLPALATRVFEEAQRVLILSAAPEGLPKNQFPPEGGIDEVLLRATADAIFLPIKPMLDALRKDDLGALAAFPDLRFDAERTAEVVEQLASIRRTEILRTIRAARNAGTKQRRRIKAAANKETAALIGSIPLSGSLLEMAHSAEAAGKDLVDALRDQGAIACPKQETP